MTGRQIITPAQNTWCPGCGNFSIQFTLKSVLKRWRKRENPSTTWSSCRE